MPKMIKARSLQSGVYIILDGVIYKTRIVTKVVNEDKVQWSYNKMDKKTLQIYQVMLK